MREESIDCSFARYGKFKLAAKPEHFDKLARSQALLAANVDADTRLVQLLRYQEFCKLFPRYARQSPALRRAGRPH